MRVAKEGDAAGGRGDLGVPQAGACAVCCGGAIIIKKARRAAGRAGESSFFSRALIQSITGWPVVLRGS